MTSVLTDEKLTEIYKRANNIGEGKNPPISTKFIFAAMRAMRAETIASLAAGVSVEPSFFNVMDGKTAYIPYYTPKQFTTAIAAARVAALKEGDSPPTRTPG